MRDGKKREKNVCREERKVIFHRYFLLLLFLRETLSTFRQEKGRKFFLLEGKLKKSLVRK